MTASESFDLEIIEDHPPIAMFTAPNPGPKTLEGTHTYVVGRDQAYVIDPGPEIPTYQQGLARWIQSEGIHAVGILLTHGHPDHAPGAALLAGLLGSPVWGSSAMDAPAGLTTPVMAYGPETAFQVDEDVLDVLPAPGHSQDHVVFWLEKSGILFSGDTILGRGTSLVAPPEGDMTVYLETLTSLRSLGARRIAPGHGPIVDDPVARIDEYIRHRLEREAQILAALSLGPMSVQELVGKLYADVDPRLHGLAAGSVEAHLVKLERETRVRRAEREWELS
jgi:glyoxylase-like metal-dependent hydrolase (beta-lactamase superfamily II)